MFSTFHFAKVVFTRRLKSLAEGEWVPFADEGYDSSSCPGKSKWAFLLADVGGSGAIRVRPTR